MAGEKGSGGGLRPRSVRGRPPLPEGARRDTLFNVRLSADELAAVQTKAMLEGKTPSEWARRTLLSAVHKPPWSKLTAVKHADGRMEVDGTVDDLRRIFGAGAFASGPCEPCKTGRHKDCVGCSCTAASK